MVDLFHDVQPLRDLPKTRVVAVEVRCVFAVVDDEELRASSVSSSVGHAEHAFVMVLVVAVELAVNRVTWPSASDALRTTSLGHKSWDDPVELQSFVEPFFGELDEVGHGVGGILLKKLHGHGAVVGVNLCVHGAKKGFLIVSLTTASPNHHLNT